jgi:hypothetical protein
VSAGLVVIDGAAAVVGLVELGQGCRALGIDSAAGRVHVVQSSSDATPDGALVTIVEASEDCPIDAGAPRRAGLPACVA